MADCIECGEYTKFNGGLCSKCYSKKNQKVAIDSYGDLNFLDEEEGGLSEKEKNTAMA